MQLEVILPLVAYLVVVFGISVYAMRKRSTGTFLNEYFLGSRSMGGIVLAMTLHRDLYQCQFVYRRARSCL
ncbi:sodium/panthothenate symporter [Escherichia coli]|uniref:Sodium/panthothenate symporter n=1 Tax=Escherichia coli TaxID=562 RepID=A0A377C716_ECOLX|nr:sodium/panthothenate symporter [Escherichia coli]